MGMFSVMDCPDCTRARKTQNVLTRGSLLGLLGVVVDFLAPSCHRLDEVLDLERERPACRVKACKQSVLISCRMAMSSGKL